MRSVACLAAAALAAAALAHDSRAATPARCTTAHLRLSLVRSEGATSHRFWDLALRNAGPASCRLQGYPGVGLLDRSGRLIAVEVDRVGGRRTPSVIVAPGQRAFFTFTYVVSGPCLPRFFSAYGLQVIPPNRRQRLVLHSGRFDVCSPAVGGRPRVYPIRRNLALG
jgi:hypothetical protein